MERALSHQIVRTECIARKMCMETHTDILKRSDKDVESRQEFLMEGCE